MLQTILKSVEHKLASSRVVCPHQTCYTSLGKLVSVLYSINNLFQPSSLMIFPILGVGTCNNYEMFVHGGSLGPLQHEIMQVQ